MKLRLLCFAIVLTLVTSYMPHDDAPVLTYARCTGNSPCRACSNCSYCNWCNSGGTCGICTRAPKTTTQKRALQCQATTKKGKQCSRAAKEGSKYCWQHGK